MDNGERPAGSTALVPVPASSLDRACSFCGKPRSAVEQLAGGTEGKTICDECVGLCLEITRQERS
ncbi:MAG: hypothetical protein LC721_10455 [Actinobacteria bacterium]|nr:hypothetical protein [Actinomycetota bacterium]